MLAFALASKPCSEATNMLYLVPGPLTVDVLGWIESKNIYPYSKNKNQRHQLSTPNPTTTI